MIIKKFQANTEIDAILLAKEDLGKDAIVMNIKTIKPKGIYKFFKKELVEITAATDDTVNYSNERVLKKSKEVQSYSMEDVLNPKEGIETSAIEQRLNNLQDLLEMQMKSKVDEEKAESEPIVETKKNIEYIQLIYNQLLNNEVDEKYANQIINEIEKVLKEDANMDNILSGVYQKIILKLGQPKLIELTEGKTKFIFFMGPTGVGKTTTIAKIASDFKLNKKKKVALVTSDTYRIAAVEQLRTYGNILGIPLKVVYSHDEIEVLKEEFESCDLVLIDTAGRSHRNIEQRDDLEKIINSISEEDRETYLVLSATTKYRDLIKITETYSEITNYNLIFTKLDETNCIGNIYNIHMLTGAPLSYITWGQNVPEDISKIDTQSIAKKLLGGND